jgi:AcrR family transcriptional regulator
MSPASADPERRKSYHHGALHSALVEASIALAREGGPDRVILREAARAAGVSHSAAYRHFADREALLAEVSRFARGELAAEMRRRVARARGPRQRLRAIGIAYIDYALKEPGLFRTAFTSHPATSPVAEQDRADAQSADGGAEPFEILGEALDQCEAAGLLNPNRRPGAEIAVWSAVHGLASLLLDGPLPRTAAGIEFARRQVLEMIERGLLNGGAS